jgi:hypothetical protein
VEFCLNAWAIRMGFLKENILVPHYTKADLLDFPGVVEGCSFL